MTVFCFLFFACDFSFFHFGFCAYSTTKDAATRSVASNANCCCCSNVIELWLVVEASRIPGLPACLPAAASEDASEDASDANAATSSTC